MKFLVLAFAVFAAARAATLTSREEYLPPIVDNNLPTTEYLPPDATTAAAQEVAAPNADGYRYKVVRRLRLRHRRDVSELPVANEYLPPATAENPEDVVAIDIPVTDAPAEVQTQLAQDGYRYKVVRRRKYRQRRDVSELPENEYLPPATEAPQDTVVVEAATEVPVDVNTAAPEDSAVLADDGYRYKVVRRIRYRQRRRRDVDEAPVNEYLPPTEVSPVDVAEEAPVEAVAAEEKTALADDGYRYKVVRRLKYRQRRDVSELPQNEYLPPAAAESPAVVVEEAPVEAAEEQTIVADDGYRYKVVRRLKYRHRRDVNELPENEYLPPAEAAQDAVVVEEPAEPAAAEESAVLADDGYRYKVVRRLKYRQRRDVDEAPVNEYLPPSEESATEEVAAEAPIEPTAAEEKTVLADDGYRYKVVRRLKYRQRRDVSELPANEYLPPTVESDDTIAVAVPAESQTETVLADDGYRYKTVRRLKYRRH